MSINWDRVRAVLAELGQEVGDAEAAASDLASRADDEWRKSYAARDRITTVVNQLIIKNPEQSEAIEAMEREILGGKP